MNHRIFTVAVVGVLLASHGCSNSNDPDPVPPPPPVMEEPENPPIPTISTTQIDRMGRAAVTSALVSPLADSATRGTDRDNYNMALQDDWPQFAENIRGSLGVYDSVDAQCGNQILADAGALDATRYDGFANALVDDRLYVNSASGSCGQYFGVELNATGLVTNNDCGGRAPSYDVIDVTYTAVSNDLSIPVGDGVDSDNVMVEDTLFPFLAEFTPAPSAPAVNDTQIDRMGRAAVTSALISPLAESGPQGMDRDDYNAAAPANWTDFDSNVRSSLAVYDSLDGACSNQILADASQSDSERYATLASVLIDDRLYVNGQSGSCGQYLGVELAVTGLAPAAASDCGGRTPLYDTIDTTYTAVSNDLSIAVGDGVTSDNVVHSADTFPFLQP